MNRTLLGFSLVLSLGMLMPRSAEADKGAARAHAAKAQAAQSRGEYQTAIAEFKRAYAAFSSAQFLYNIAQIYRKNSDCSNALQYYELFLAHAPFEQATLSRAAQVARKYQSTLRRECPPADPVHLQPRSEPDMPTPYPSGPAHSEPAHSEPAVVVEPPLHTGPPSPPPSVTTVSSRRMVRVTSGANRYVLGDVIVPTTGMVQGSYVSPLAFGQLDTWVIATVGVSPMRYRVTMDKTDLAYFIPALVGLELASDANGKDGIVIRGALQVGVLGITGLKEGNPMTEDRLETGLTVSLVAKAQISVGIPLNSNWSVTAGVEASLGSAPDGFASDIQRISSVGAMAGISRAL
ncbi:MAG: hypothetical protein JKY56_19475 [Kofleriaceae bacterium]|nr:hypothetical protein [Kofleriaceae bacterium]